MIDEIKKEDQIASICKQCKKVFSPYKITYECNNCGGEGYCEPARDIDYYSSSGHCKCYECCGSGEITRLETRICSEDCWENYERETLGL